MCFSFNLLHCTFISICLPSFQDTSSWRLDKICSMFPGMTLLGEPDCLPEMDRNGRECWNSLHLGPIFQNGVPFSFQFRLSLWNGQMRNEHLWCCISLEIPTIRMTDGLSSLRLTVRQALSFLSSVSLFKLENATSAKWVSVDPSSLHQTNYITCRRPHWWCIWYTSCIWLHGIIL